MRLLSDAFRSLVRLLPRQSRRNLAALPIVGPLQRRFVSLMLDGSEFEYVVDSGPAKGVKFLIRMPEDKGIWTGGYEWHFAEVIAAEMRAHAGSVAYDVGGWHGFFAGVMAANGAKSVHVFEPLPKNQERIQHFISLNPKYQIELHRVAVGDFDREVELIVLSDSSMAKLAISSFQMDVTGNEMLNVPARSLDSLIASGAIPPPALIKLDIEGGGGSSSRRGRQVADRAQTSPFYGGSLRRVDASML